MQWVNTWRSLLFLQKIKDFFLSLKNMHLKFEKPRCNCSPSFHRQSIKEHRKVICYQSMMPVERIKQLPLKFMRILPFQATGSATFAVKHISLGLIKRWTAVVVYLLNFSEIFSYLINWIGGNTPLHLERISICKHVILRRKKSQVLYQPN